MVLTQVSWHCAISGQYFVRNSQGFLLLRCNFVVLGFRGKGQEHIKNPKAINQTANQTRLLHSELGSNQGAEDEDRMSSHFLHPKPLHSNTAGPQLLYRHTIQVSST